MSAVPSFGPGRVIEAELHALATVPSGSPRSRLRDMQGGGPAWDCSAASTPLAVRVEPDRVEGSWLPSDRVSFRWACPTGRVCGCAATGSAKKPRARGRGAEGGPPPPPARSYQLDVQAAGINRPSRRRSAGPRSAPRPVIANQLGQPRHGRFQLRARQAEAPRPSCGRRPSRSGPSAARPAGSRRPGPRPSPSGPRPLPRFAVRSRSPRRGGSRPSFQGARRRCRRRRGASRPRRAQTSAAAGVAGLGLGEGGVADAGLDLAAVGGSFFFSQKRGGSSRPLGPAARPRRGHVVAKRRAPRSAAPIRPPALTRGRGQSEVGSWSASRRGGRHRRVPQGRGARRRANDLQPLAATKGAVEAPVNGRHVGHGRQRDKVEQGDEVGAGAAPPSRNRRFIPPQLDPAGGRRPRRRRDGRGLPSSSCRLGVHHGDAVGQLGACEVVVEDDDVRALGGGDGAGGRACRQSTQMIRS